MADVKKTIDELQGTFEEAVSKAAKIVENSTKEWSGTVNKERRKMELRSQIGQHQRNVTKAYTRLGEAYFKYVEKGESMNGVGDVLDILRSNTKVIELLNEQLKALDEN